MIAPIVYAAAPRRHARRRERGFTLIELLVTTAIMSVVAGGIGGAFAIGTKVMSRGGVQDRLAGANDGMVFEQLLSRDVSRTSCVKVGGSLPSGSCSKGFASSAITSDCPPAVSSAVKLCVAWPVISDTSCHVAAYTQSASTGLVSRTEYRVVYGDVSLGDPPTTVATLQTTRMGTDPFRPFDFAQTLTAAGTWVSGISVTLINAVVIPSHNPPTVNLVVRPLVGNPSGPGTAAGIPRQARC